jgi:hypothetical protein
MAWYYYNGNTVLSIQIGNGEVIAARPHSTFFVDPTAENSASFKRLSRVLRRTGAPRGATVFVPEKPIGGAIVSPPNIFSDSFIEGKAAITNDSDTPLVKKYEVAIVAEPEVVSAHKPVVSAPDEPVEDEEVDTEVDSKVDENTEDSPRKRKRRGI